MSDSSIRYLHVADLPVRSDFCFTPLVLMSNPSEVVDKAQTFTSCNLTQDINTTRPHHQPKLTNAHKVSADAKHEINKENASALQLEINTFLESRSIEIVLLSKKFNKSEAKIKQLINNETSYHNMHALSLHNALVHAKGVEMNEGKSTLQWVPLVDKLTCIYKIASPVIA